MADAEIPEQLYAPGFELRRSGTRPVPPQLMEFPAVGWVLVKHAPGISIAAVDRDPDEREVGIIFYRGGSGDQPGSAHISVLSVAMARDHAARIIAACDRVDAGIDASSCARRPPAGGR